jgi:hypothetical protein
MGRDDVNFFTIPLQKKRVNTLIVECTQRGVCFSQAFFFDHSNAYLALDVNMRNELRAMAQDVPSVKE